MQTILKLGIFTIWRVHIIPYSKIMWMPVKTKAKNRDFNLCPRRVNWINMRKFMKCYKNLTVPFRDNKTK